MPHVRTLNPRTRGIGYERDGNLHCVVSWLLRVSDVMTSQDTGGVGQPGGRVAASVCWRGQARSLWWLPSSSGCTARGWGATGGGWGALWVGGVIVQ